MKEQILQTATGNVHELNDGPYEPFVVNVGNPGTESYSIAEKVSTTPKSEAGAKEKEIRFNSAGHERMAKVGAFLKNGKDRLKNAATATGRGLMRLFKGGKNLVKEGVATVLSTPELVSNAWKKSKEIASSVKNAAVSRTREAVTAAGNSIRDGYESVKMGGEMYIQQGKEAIKGVKDKYAKMKLEIALRSLQRRRDESEAKTTRLQSLCAEKRALLEQFA